MSSLIVKVILASFKGASARRENIDFSTVEMILSGRTHLQHLRSSDGYRVPICITTQSFAEVGFFSGGTTTSAWVLARYVSNFIMADQF